MNVQEFIDAYIESALWSSTDNSRDDGGDPLDDNYGPTDLTTLARQVMEGDCKDFIRSNQVLLTNYMGWLGKSAGDAGHDFWLTRNGHGTGFWDRYYGDDPKLRNLVLSLTEASKPYGSQDLYVTDDGKVDVT